MKEIYSQVERRLDDLRKELNLENLSRKFSLWLIIAILAIIIVGAIEIKMFLPSSARKPLFTFGLVFLGGSFLVYVLPAILRFFGLLKTIDDLQLARLVGERHPEVGDKLIDALQIYREKINKKIPYSEELLESAFAQLANESLKHNWQIVEPRRTRQRFAISFLALLIFLTTISLWDDFNYALIRIVNFDKKFLKPSDYEIKVEPGDVTIPKGETVRIKLSAKPLKATTPLPDKVELWITQSGSKEIEKITLKPTEKGKGTAHFEHMISNIRFPIDYFFKLKDITTEKYKIGVVDKPALKLLKVELVYPSYTKFPPEYLDDNAGDISAVVGTVAKVKVFSSKTLSSAKVVFGDSSFVELKTDGNEASGGFKVSKTTTYHIEICDENGLKNENPIEYKITAIPDEYPTVQVVQPGKSVDITRDMQVGILARIKDDFGFTRLRLAYRLSFSRYVKPQENFTFVDIPIDRNSREQEIPYVWDLSELELSPNDVVSYYLEVFDNDEVSGPKSSRTEIYTLRFPSLHEILAQADEARSEIYQDIKDILEKAKKLRKEMDEIDKEMKKGNFQSDWQRQQKLQNIAKEYEELRKKIQETNQKLQEFVQKLDENKLLSPETLEKYLELQKLLNQLNIPELKELMKRFEQAIQNINPDLLRQAMEKFQFSEENFRRSIERTLNLLKRIQIEQKLNEILKQAEQIINKQEEIRKQTMETNPEDKAKLNELSQRQKELREEMERIEESLEDLKEKMNEFKNEMPVDSLEKMLSELRNKRFEEKFEMAGEKIRSGNLKEAGQMQFELSQSLMQMRESLQAIQQQMMQNQQQQILTQMRKVQKDLLSLSKKQEDLKQETKSTMQSSPQLRELARRQMELLSDLNSVANSLIELSQKTFVITPDMGREIGSAVANMYKSVESLTARDNLNAFRSQDEAMNSLNRAIIQLGNAMQAMMQAGAGGGLQFLLQQLNQIAMQQLGLNQATQELMQRLSLEQQAEMARLAAQQELIRKSLQELMKEAELSGNRSKILGDLNRIAEDMKEVVSDLESGNLNENTLRKQERILSRLLDAQRSIHERDFEKRRESRPGQNIVRQSPAELNPQVEDKEKIFQELLKSVQENYHRDYETLIKKYFELLRSLQD